MKRIIYYFTGTGNSMRAARVIAKKIPDCEIISMRLDPHETPADECDMIGFVFPVYHWTLPDPVVAFVRNLSINPDAYIFAVGMPSLIGGIALEKLDEILKEKGARIDYGTFVYSKANYVLVYPPFPSTRSATKRSEKQLEKVSMQISTKMRNTYPRANQLIRKRQQKAMGPYDALAPYADYPFTVNDSCISCGLCEKVCPVRNIEMKDGKPSFLHHCAQCMACVSNCPQRAIGYDVKHSAPGKVRFISSRTPVVALMGLPGWKKTYRNPYISAADLTKEREKK